MQKPLVIALAIAASLLAVAAVLYTRNATPVVPQVAAHEAAAPGAPWVVKLHAQWCPVCMWTKGVWSDIEHTYASRVRLVVLDFTNDATTAASRAEAERLGLGDFFEEAGFATGPIAVLDGRDRHVVAWVNGSRDFADYRAAIESALAASPR
jgi:hypothetical protein